MSAMAADEVDSEFCRELLSKAAQTPPSTPRVFYNDDGDCIEFLISDEGFRAERIDKLVTVYYGRESGEIVGSLIKGVKRFVREMIEQSPGFVVEVQDRNILLTHIFTAGMWMQGDRLIGCKYKKLREAVDPLKLAVQLPEFAGC